MRIVFAESISLKNSANEECPKYPTMQPSNIVLWLLTIDHRHKVTTKQKVQSNEVHIKQLANWNSS